MREVYTLQNAFIENVYRDHTGVFQVNKIALVHRKIPERESNVKYATDSGTSL